MHNDQNNTLVHLYKRIYNTDVNKKIRFNCQFNNNMLYLFFEKTKDEMDKYENIIQKYNKIMTNNPIVDAIKLKIDKIDKLENAIVDKVNINNQKYLYSVILNSDMTWCKVQQ